MNASSDILEHLICNNCKGPLSCGPVYLTLKGHTFCGRCKIPAEPSVRNKHYELTAQFLRFPCMFEDYGCDQTLAFSDNVQHRHEVICAYHPYKCPKSKFKCNWLGLRSQVLEHFNLKHPAKILTNPCTLPLEITESNEDVYLLLAFQEVFILHRKICIKSKKVDVSVQYFGDPEKIFSFKYTLDITRNEFIISKPGQVYLKEQELENENTFLTTAINSILEVMADVNNINMTITVKHINETDLNHSRYLRSLDSDLYTNESKLCRNNTNGCNYADLEKKCEKHERYFCTLNGTCPLCPEEVLSLENHFSLIHSEILHSTGISWPARLFDWELQYLILECPEVRSYILCRYKLCWSQFSLAILTPLSSEVLRNYKCYIKIQSSTTGQKETFVPELTLHEIHDWSITTTLDKRNNIEELMIQIDIMKNQQKIEERFAH